MKKVAWSQFWRIKISCHATSCMHVVIQGNYPLPEIFVQKIKYCRRSTSTILHEHRNIKTVLQSSMNSYKFFQNPKISHSIYRLLSRKWHYYYFFEKTASPYHYFWWLQGLRFSNIWIFVSPNRRFLLVDKTVEWNIYSSENHMLLILSWPSSTNCSIAFQHSTL